MSYDKLFAMSIVVGGVALGYFVLSSLRQIDTRQNLYNNAVVIADTNKDGNTDKKEIAEMYKKMNIGLVEGQPIRNATISDLERYINDMQTTEINSDK